MSFDNRTDKERADDLRREFEDREVRRIVSKELGIDIFEPKELEEANKVEPPPEPEPPKIVAITVNEVMRRLQDAYSKMGESNSHRNTVKLAANTIHQLASRLEMAESELAKLRPTSPDNEVVN